MSIAEAERKMVGIWDEMMSKAAENEEPAVVVALPGTAAVNKNTFVAAEVPIGC